MIQTSSAGKRCSPIPNLHGLIPKPVPLAFNFTCTSKANRETAQPEAAVSTHRVPSTGPLGSPPPGRRVGCCPVLFGVCAHWPSGNQGGDSDDRCSAARTSGPDGAQEGRQVRPGAALLSTAQYGGPGLRDMVSRPGMCLEHPWSPRERGQCHASRFLGSHCVPSPAPWALAPALTSTQAEPEWDALLPSGGSAQALTPIPASVALLGERVSLKRSSACIGQGLAPGAAGRLCRRRRGVG